ncbi:MAG: NAD(+) synthase [Oscillospiraceae bacterium]|nr:NAD(+) synthase [Oscillospiraceae bacterium]
MKDGFLRTAAASPKIKPGDCEYNAEQVIKIIKEAAGSDVSLIVFPELCITGYTCGDLFFQSLLINAAEKALLMIAAATKGLDVLSVIGLPVELDGKLYNAAAVIKGGAVLGIVPKENITCFGGKDEARYFASGRGVSYATERFGGVYFGRQLFECGNLPNLVIGVEIGEDVQAVIPPSAELALGGATLVCCPSALSAEVGIHDKNAAAIEAHSERLICGYIQANAGEGESTQDFVFKGYKTIAENGLYLFGFSKAGSFVSGDIDLSLINAERRRKNIFNISDTGIPRVYFELNEKEINLARHYPANPFFTTPEDDFYSDVMNLMTLGLKTRLEAINFKKVIIGLSGGLDSTLALIAAVNTFERQALDKSDIITISLPCFGTSERTKNNARKLAEAYGVTFREINITDTVSSHFKDIGLDESNRDTAYENAQARERMQVLFDIANMERGIVLGTGNLSELALGWSTYGGDSMSMYGINAGIPKTLVRKMIEIEAENCSDDENKKQVLLDILNTPISPELLPGSQKTEELIGPYELHDFFIYYFLRYSFSPSKILRIAVKTFEGEYAEAEIKKWLAVFIKRFYGSQFKRNCMPDGASVLGLSLSSRTGLKMPSEATVKLWLENFN